jgi:hypothetical protein
MMFCVIPPEPSGGFGSGITGDVKSAYGGVVVATVFKFTLAGAGVGREQVEYAVIEELVGVPAT